MLYTIQPSKHVFNALYPVQNRQTTQVAFIIYNDCFFFLILIFFIHFPFGFHQFVHENLIAKRRSVLREVWHRKSRELKSFMWTLSVYVFFCVMLKWNATRAGFSINLWSRVCSNEIPCDIHMLFSSFHQSPKPKKKKNNKWNRMTEKKEIKN